MGGYCRILLPEEYLPICQAVAEGATITQATRNSAVSQASFFVALQKQPEIAEEYARARELQLALWEDQLIDIADDGRNDWIEREDGTLAANHDHLNRSKLRVETRKWLMSKRLPKKYGDRVQIDDNRPEEIREVQYTVVKVSDVPDEDEADTQQPLRLAAR